MSKYQHEISAWYKARKFYPTHTMFTIYFPNFLVLWIQYTHKYASYLQNFQETINIVLTLLRVGLVRGLLIWAHHGWRRAICATRVRRGPVILSATTDATWTHRHCILVVMPDTYKNNCVSSRNINKYLRSFYFV